MGHLDSGKFTTYKTDFALISAVSEDGFIARDSVDPLKWVPLSDKQWYRQFTIKIKHLIVGKSTFEILPQKALEYRTFYVLTGNPTVLSDRLLARGFEVVSSNRKMGAYGKGGKNAGVFVGPKDTQVVIVSSLSRLLTYLASQGVSKAAVIGGASVYSLFLQRGLVKEAYISKISIKLGAGIEFPWRLLLRHFGKPQKVEEFVGYRRLYFVRD